jgi:hypothetical protein
MDNNNFMSAFLGNQAQMANQEAEAQAPQEASDKSAVEVIMAALSEIQMAQTVLITRQAIIEKNLAYLLSKDEAFTKALAAREEAERLAVEKDQEKLKAQKDVNP